MIVRFTKARHADRPHTFTCVRDDGTTIGMPSTEFFVRHDLGHYAIETTLSLEDAFYGLLAKGWDLSSFEERLPGSRKVRAVPTEAELAERLAGLLDLDWAAGETPAEEVIALLRRNFGPEVHMPRIEDIGRIRERRGELLNRWAALDDGAVLELRFPDAG